MVERAETDRPTGKADTGNQQRPQTGGPAPDRARDGEPEDQVLVAPSNDGKIEEPFYNTYFHSSFSYLEVGYALYFYSYSSWAGRAIYMEDLYVMPEFRGKGIGKALMSKVAQLGLAAGCNQLNFTVLDWNKSSRDFYMSQGCCDVTTSMGYHCMRCEGEALQHLAQP
uniref:Spermidine/spermine N1-acetyltransferase family member 2a, tandem duplicate 2 n=1 Tax=Oryzias sinensis TaxID=183150 RepID=A0A8C7YWB2_9TELE